MFDTRSMDDGTFAQRCFEATWRAAVDRDPGIERDSSLREDTRVRLARAVIEGVSQNGADVDAVVAFALRAIPSFRDGS